MNRLKEKYLNEVVPSLKEKYNYKSIMEVPKLEKVVINMGVGDATTNSKLLEASSIFCFRIVVNSSLLPFKNRIALFIDSV